MFQFDGSRGRLSGNAIKMIAVLAMILDHIGWAFVPTESVAATLMHTIGKVTGPIMFYFIAEGYHYSHNHKRYAGRLVVFALLSHIPYNLFVNKDHITLLPTSVIFTLLCGLLALMAYHQIQDHVVKWTAIMLLVGVTFWADWQLWGVLFCLCFGIYYGDRHKQTVAYLAANACKLVWTVYYYKWNPYWLLPVIISPLLVLGLLSLYNGTKGKGRYAKWAFYIVYPLQFLVIGGLSLLWYR